MNTAHDRSAPVVTGRAWSGAHPTMKGVAVQGEADGKILADFHPGGPVPGVVRAQLAYEEATRRVEIARAARDGTVRGHERAQRKALADLLKAELFDGR